jgi:hypothetical protein
MKKCQWEGNFKRYIKKKDVCNAKQEEIQVRLLQERKQKQNEI